MQGTFSLREVEQVFGWAAGAKAAAVDARRAAGKKSFIVFDFIWMELYCSGLMGEEEEDAAMRYAAMRWGALECWPKRKACVYCTGRVRDGSSVRVVAILACSTLGLVPLGSLTCLEGSG